jgi:hypothetical protein
MIIYPEPLNYNNAQARYIVASFFNIMKRREQIKMKKNVDAKHEQGVVPSLVM